MRRFNASFYAVFLRIPVPDSLRIFVDYATLAHMKQQIIDYLNRDRMANIDMLEVLALPKAVVVQSNENGVLLEHDNVFFLANNPGVQEPFLKAIADYPPAGNGRLVVARDCAVQVALEQDYGFQTVMECRHAVYNSTRPVPYALPDDAEIHMLDQSHLDFVHTHYQMVDDVEYIRDRIKEGMFGVFLHGQIAGFVGTHEERPMGLLEILPEYRRLGLAYALEAHLINHLLSLGRVPFCQVAMTNKPSIQLQEKLGLTFSETVIYWLEQTK